MVKLQPFIIKLLVLPKEQVILELQLLVKVGLQGWLLGLQQLLELRQLWVLQQGQLLVELVEAF